MSNWNEEVYETLSRLVANGEKNSLVASIPVSPPENDKLCASLIENELMIRSLAASVKSNNTNNRSNGNIQFNIWHKLKVKRRKLPYINGISN